MVIAALACLTLALAGCSDSDDSQGVTPPIDREGPREALVFNQSSDNISSVDIATGTVTPDWGSLAIGPTANRAMIRGNNAYVINSGAFPSGTGAGIQVIDLDTRAVTNTIPLPDGSNPWDLAFVSDSKLYVTCLYDNVVVIVNPLLQGADAVVDTIALPVFDGPEGPVPAGPEGIVVAGGYAYTANTGFDAATFGYMPGTVSVIDTATDDVVDLIYTSQVNPQDLAVGPNGRIHVVCTGDYWSAFGVLDVIDPETRSVESSVALGGSPGNITIAGDYALIGAGGSDGCDLHMVDVAAQSVVHDNSDPWILAETTDWCTVGKIAGGQGPGVTWAYVPTGVWGTDARLFELHLAPGGPTVSRSFDLTGAADMPAAVGLLYE